MSKDLIQEIQNLKPKYRNGRDKIGDDFINPCLKACIFWRRTTLGFSSSTLKSWGGSFTNILQEVEKIEILADISQFDERDKTLMRALEHNSNTQERNKTLLRHSENIILTALSADKAPSVNREHIWSLLHYLLASEKLEIRFAINRISNNSRNLYHEKSGYFHFPDGESLAHVGSFNESDSGYQYNNESVRVFWKSKEQIMQDAVGHSDDFNDYKSTVKDVDDDWNGNEWVEVHKLSKETLKKIKQNAPKSFPLKPKNSPIPPEDLPHEIKTNVPIIPKNFKGKPFRMERHQTNALKKWAKKNYQGILHHATGSGKTITSIYGACKIAEQGKNILVIGVPYQSLADQWVEELKTFNLSAIKCYESYANWGLEAEKQIARFKAKDNDASFILPLVVVNKTLASEAFQNLLGDIDKEYLIFVGDECHRYASEGAIKSLPSASYKLGLSATPFSEYEASELDNQSLRNYFGDVCDEFSIADAMSLGVLCKYEYHPIPIHLSESEYETYHENYQRIYAVPGDSDSEVNMAAVSEMNRTLGSAEEKFNKLHELVQNGAIKGRTIIFCGDGSTEVETGTTQLTLNELKDKERVNSILESGRILRNFFTSDEGAKRRREILKAFNDNDTQCLISIRVLDEGIDVPGVETAILMASTRNRRQFIQRRGRVLRKAEDKSIAIIYDMVCLPPKGVNNSHIVDGEIARVADMMDVCVNREKSINLIHQLQDRYVLKDETIEKIRLVLDE
ncbi:DEAD/DEAH box helicase family protein [Gammaproteobacteria bacterium]|nr:DEAD/DEAH box helicase family protein [Gammaproteobacteria bacterium]